MIKKTIICFLIILIGYIVFRDVLKPDIVISQDQWQDNQIKAQGYLYSDTLYANNIIVGSSLSTRIVADSLKNTFNLAMGGESPFQGLEAICRKGVYPKRVFIEINTLYNSHSNFNDILYNPLLFHLRKYSSTFRDGKQPLPLIENIFEDRLAYHLIPSRFTFFDREGVDAGNISNMALDNMLSGLQERYSRSISKEDQSVVMTKLKYYVGILQENHVNIVFIELPLDGTLYDTPFSNDIRNSLERTFPPKQYTYIYTDWSGYETTDGLHMGKENALKYTLFLRDQIDRLSNLR